MRPNEARYIGALIARLANEEIGPVLNLGSSTLRIRTVDFPHIDREIFAPLRARGVPVIHADLKIDEGVDIAGDVYDPAVQSKLRAIGPRLLICCNILEHVRDPAEFANICASLLAPGGMLIVTVPFSYPFHPDPIDTYFRPSPEEVARLFDRFEISESRIVEDVSYLHELRRTRRPSQVLRQFAAHGVKFFAPFGNLDAWKARYHRYLWLLRPYKVSCVLLRRESRA
jgi:hypothetical protein